MLLKEYRIPLPLSVEEYRVAQLYMIAKKSREESKGAGSGVEILVNEPYTDGPGGSGQYTHKIYHVGSHLPGWFKALLPKSALTVEEEAWNAYPYTKTRYTCPFVERFYLEIETKYLDDAGHQENVFDLGGSELRSRQVDLIDVVKDQLYGGDYVREEDPTIYVSLKTGRGPLTTDWIQDCDEAARNGNKDSIMCAYKLCRVEFRYWGMQSKIEKFIHDVALRKTMLRAHRQAWSWQDEWVGLTMEDIREIERETQEALARKMAGEEESVDEEDKEPSHPVPTVDLNIIDKDKDNGSAPPLLTRPRSRSPSPHRALVTKPHDLPLLQMPNSEGTPKESLEGRRKAWQRSNSKGALHSPGASSTQSFDLQLANWRMESILKETDSSSDEEFFDAEDAVGYSPMQKWSSMELISAEHEKDTGAVFSSGTPEDDSIFSPAYIRKMQMEHRPVAVSGGGSLDVSLPGSPTASPVHHPCPTSALIFVLHAGNVLDSGVESAANKKADYTTFKGAIENAIKQHYPSMIGRVVIKLISCPAICSEALVVLSNLSPYSFQASPSAIDGAFHTQDSIPLGALPLFAVSSPEYHEHVSRVISNTNQVYHEFLRSEDGLGFMGQIVLIGDCMGSVLAFDALCRTNQLSSRFGSENSINEDSSPPAQNQGQQGQQQQQHHHHPSQQQSHQQSSLQQQPHNQSHITPRPNPLISISDGSGNEDIDEGMELLKKSSVVTTPSRTYQKSHSHSEAEPATHDASSLQRLLSAPPPRRSSSCSSDQGSHHRFDFDVNDFFMFGSPLGLVLAYRKMLSFDDKNAPLPRPSCTQVYNLFHPTDPLASRIEPLISARFSQLPPVNVPRYQKYPLGDGQPIHLLEYIQSHAHIFLEGVSNVPGTYMSMGRRTSEASITSTMSGISESVPIGTVTTLTQKWWGTKRLDYALYCPEGLANFPVSALPHLFHASYWESTDVVALILRQLIRCDNILLHSDIEKEVPVFVPGRPREKWLKKRTSVKIKNVTANHRANDVIVKEGEPQVLTARFMYGPLDMVALTGEKIDIHVMKDMRNGEWTQIGTEMTEKNGRVTYTIPKEKALGFGMFPVKMVVRGDHTAIDFFLAVVPPKTECVVFSIDGSFTASVSVTGRDPKVRAGAVDIVRHWQELGYLIIYITGRPDMQQQRVVSWLAQHNFPHGLVSFTDGICTDPLRHKAEYLRRLLNEADVVYHAAYGSSKDIWVYSSLGLKPEQIFIVGKASKKQHSMATVLSEGYASHLSDLKAPGASRPAQGNARMVLPRGCFGLPGQGSGGLRRRRSAKRTTSYPLSGPVSEARMRGMSPKPGNAGK